MASTTKEVISGKKVSLITVLILIIFVCFYWYFAGRNNAPSFESITDKRTEYGGTKITNTSAGKKMAWAVIGADEASSSKAKQRAKSDTGVSVDSAKTSVSSKVNAGNRHVKVVNQQSLSDGVIFSDGFERGERSINGSRSPDGLNWIGNGLKESQIDSSRTPRIVNGRTSLTKAGAGYAWITTQASFGRVREWVVFKSGTTKGAYAGLIISKSRGNSSQHHPAEVAGRSVHLAWGINFLELRLYDSVNHHKSLLVDRYRTIKADGKTPYFVQLKVDPNNKDRLAVVSPDGTINVVEDPLISDLWGKTILIENYQPPNTFSTDKLPQIELIKAWNK